MNRYIIGLYGQVGTGKSTVSEYLHKKGWCCINQDQLGHEVIREYPQELISMFGEGILEDSGVIDRKKLGKIVFENKEQLTKLVAFSYPIIIDKTKALLNTTQQHTVIEGAFFYKIRDSILYTHLMYIYVELSILKNRLIHRGHSLSWINQVLSSQDDIVSHKDLANFSLNNSSTLDVLYNQIDRSLESLSESI